MRELCQSDLAGCLGFQRAAQGCDCLDQIPRMVSYFSGSRSTVAECGVGRGHIIWQPAARQAAMQLTLRRGHARRRLTSQVSLRQARTGGCDGVRSGDAPKSTTPPSRGFWRTAAWNRDLDRPDANTSYFVDDRYTFTPMARVESCLSKAADGWQEGHRISQRWWRSDVDQ